MVHRKTAAKRAPPEHKAVPAHGSVGAGLPFDPTAPPEHTEPKTAARTARAMPAPGTPLSESQMRKLKKRAATRGKATPAEQADPATRDPAKPGCAA